MFEHLLAGGAAPEAQNALRTFQRRVLSWRRHHGPPKEVFFPQAREPGESLQLDWTHAAELGVTIAGQKWEQLLCRAVLPYSNCERAAPCRSESMLSMRVGLQGPLWSLLGGVPGKLQTDPSSTPTHVLNRTTGERGFNVEYLVLCRHLGFEACTINPCPHENGDVESANGHLKRRLATHLTLRGSL